MKTVYTIIVTFNAMQWIDRCLQSLINGTYDTRVIIVDNGSEDETISHIQNVYPFATLIVNDRNLGFGQGNNIGISIAIKEGADFIFLLNQDAWVEENTIEKLVQAHLSNDLFGIISPIHLNGKGTDFDDHFYDYLLKADLRESLANMIRGGGELKQLVSAPFVNAACWMVSAASIKAVGGFDPIFFHYGEDDNFGQRLLYKGFRIGILSDVVVFHDKERAGKNASTSAEKLMNKEFVQFLVYACDVNRVQYSLFIIRTGLAKLVKGFFSFLCMQWKKGFYELKMGFRVFLYFNRISRSQRQSVSKQPYLHLNGLTSVNTDNKHANSQGI